MKNRKSGSQLARLGLFVALVLGGALSAARAQTPPPAPAAAATPPATAAPVPLTMQQVVDLALSKNPTLLAAQQNFLSVKAQEIQAGLRANPYFTLTAAEVTEPATVNNPYAYAAQFSRLFERGNKREWRLDSARNTTVQTDDQLQLTKQQTILAVREAFTNFIIAKAAKKVADDNLGDYKHELAIQQDRYQAGDLAKLDFERLDLQLAQFETDESTRSWRRSRPVTNCRCCSATTSHAPTSTLWARSSRRHSRSAWTTWSRRAWPRVPT